MITDTHTHNISATNAIINASPEQFNLEAGKYYSIGIHPWETINSDRYDLQKIEEIASQQCVVAIGEAGIDKLRGADLATQEKIFLFHVELSEKLRKPLIIHEVKAIDKILELHHGLHPSMPWIRHGFRGNAAIARSYYSHGIYLSIGEKFNPEAVKSIPSDKLLIETDESQLPINEVATRIATARQTTTETILNTATTNLSLILSN